MSEEDPFDIFAGDEPDGDKGAGPSKRKRPEGAGEGSVDVSGGDADDLGDVEDGAGDENDDAVAGGGAAASGDDVEDDDDGDEEEGGGDDDDDDDDDDDEDDDEEDDGDEDDEAAGEDGVPSKRVKLDDSSGQRMSKSDLKKLKKQRRLEEKLAKKGVVPGSGAGAGAGGAEKKKQKKRKLDVKKLIDDEAARDDDEGDANSDSDDAEGEEEDQDNYQLDGFVVADGEDDSSDDDVFAKRGGPKPKKTERKRLRKTGKAMLDEDDLLLVQDNEDQEEERVDEQPTRSAGGRTIAGDEDDEDEDGFIDPDASSSRQRQMGFGDDEDDEMDDFIVDDAGDEDEVAKPKAQRKRSAQPIRRMFQGPTQDEIQESIDIFGIENLDDLYGEDEDDVYEEDADPEAKKATQEAKAKEALLARSRRFQSKFEHQDMRDQFMMEKDEIIQKTDLPEQFMLYPVPELSAAERTVEAEWIARKLKARFNYEHQRFNTGFFVDDQGLAELQNSVNSVLKFMQVDKLEIQFIWTYRRDYLVGEPKPRRDDDMDDNQPRVVHPTLTRKHLWLIYTWNEKWNAMNVFRARINNTLQALEDAAASASGMQAVEEEDRNARIFEAKRQRNNLEEELRDAKNDKELKESVLDEKEKEDSDTTEEERAAYQAALARVAELEETLKVVVNALDSEEQQANDALQRKLRRVKYDPIVAKESEEKFPRSRYGKALEHAQDDQHLRDIFNCLLLHARAAEKTHVEALTAEELGKGEGEGNEQAGRRDEKTAIDTRSRLRKLAAEDKFGYYRYRRNEKLRKLADLTASRADEVGDSLHLCFDATAPEEVEEMGDLIMELVGDDADQFKTYEEVAKAVEVIIATEYAHEPFIVKEVRTKFREYATISTTPTAKGLLQITPFSELFGLHYLENKPVRNFLEFAPDSMIGMAREVGTDCIHYCKIVQAEHDGLLNVKIDYPRVGDDGNDGYMINVFGNETKISSRFMREAQYSENSYVRSDQVRAGALRSMLADHLLPALEQEVRRDMLRLGKEAILEEATRNFEQMLTLGPVRLKPYSPPEINREPEREYIKEALKRCPERPAYPTVGVLYLLDQQPFVMVYLDKDGQVRANDLIPVKAVGGRPQAILKFLKDNRPDVIIVNASGGYNTKSLLFDLEKESQPNKPKGLLDQLRFEVEKDKQNRRNRREEEGRGHIHYADDDDDEPPYRPHVTMLEDDIAKIFQHSQRAKKQFPDYDPVMCAAICLGRFAQEPLSEFCNLWTCANSVGQFGFEALFLKLHPQQGFLKSNSAMLLRSLENVLRDAVCEYGVELNTALIHEHHAARLAFVAGLGLRKAKHLRRLASKELGICSGRLELRAKEIQLDVVLKNALGFLRISEEHVGESVDLNPLDNTRIHPECYVVENWAQKICADALEVDLNQEDYHEMVLDLIKRVKEDLSKRSRSPRWLDCWLENGRPQCEVKDLIEPTQYTELVRQQGASDETFEKKMRAELPDCLSLLELDDWALELDGKRQLQIVQIKEELRYPWLDLRKPLQPPNASQLFTLLTGETDYTLHVGMKIGCTIREIRKQGDNDAGGQARQKALVQADNGLKGSIAAIEAVDNRYDLDNIDLAQILPVGAHVEAVIVGVDKRFNSLQLSVAPRYLGYTEDWWVANRSDDRHARRWFEEVGRDEKKGPLFPSHFNLQRALDAYAGAELEARSPRKQPMDASGGAMAVNGDQRRAGTVLQRPIHHPLWVNCSFEQAAERLRAQGQGQVIIRPSSKPDKISVSWISHPVIDVIHFTFDERGKVKGSSMGLGNELVYRQKIDHKTEFYESYSDLDEINARFVEPMNNLIEMMLGYEKFRPELLDDKPTEDFLIDEQMLNQQKAEQARAINPSFNKQAKPPYCITFDYASANQRMAGFHCLKIRWIKQKVTEEHASRRRLVTTHDVFVTPNGYRFAGAYYQRPKDVIKAFMDKAEAAPHQQRNMSAMMTGMGGAQQPRRSRFSAAANPSMPPQMPMMAGGYGMPQQPYMGYPPMPPVPLAYGQAPPASYGYDGGYGGQGGGRY